MSETREQYGEQPAANPQAITRLLEIGAPEAVQAKIQAKYGFTPTLAYCRDLLAFAEELLHEHA